MATLSLIENRRSRRLWTPVLGVSVALALAMPACVIIEDDDYDDGYYSYEPPPPGAPANDEPIVVPIDEGADLASEPGDGVGVIVNYDGAGRWRVTTTCDTNYSGFSCSFDLTLSATGLQLESEDSLEGEDGLQIGVDRVFFTPTTSYGSDGIVLSADENAVLRLETYLDGQSEPRFVYWFGDGVLNTGAPSNPVDFKPALSP